MKKRLYILFGLCLSSIFPLVAQHVIWQQGFEGLSICEENWGFTGGEVDSRYVRNGNGALLLGRGTGGDNSCSTSAGSPLATFDWVDVTNLENAQLEIYHSIAANGTTNPVNCGPSNGEGLDTREGAIIQVAYNGSTTWTTIGQVGGNSNHSYPWTATIGGTSNTCDHSYTMPNPLVHDVPAGSTSVRFRVISIAYGGTTGGCNAACRCNLFFNEMESANPTPSNYDRWDEGFYIDDVRLTTSSPSYPGIWTGVVSRDWHDCRNWHNLKVPTIHTDVFIPQTASDDCRITNANAVANSVAVNSAINTNRILSIREDKTLTVGVNVDVNKTGGSGTLEIDIRTGATLNIVGDLTVNKTGGSGKARVRLNTGGSPTLICRHLTLNGTVQNAEDSELDHDENNAANVYVNGNVIINAGGTIDMSDGGDPNYNGEIHVRGNWVATSSETDFKQTGSIVVFDGTGDQRVITGNIGFTGNNCSQLPCEAFHNFVINKPSGQVFLDNHLEIIGKLTYVNGIINSTQSSLLVYQNGSSYQSVSNISHTNGPVRKFGNVAFTFPIGDGIYYRPASISSPNNTNHHFTAEYIHLDPNPWYDVTLKEPSIDHISRCEYWLLDRTNGNSNVEVTLSWNENTSCGITDQHDLIVTRWDGAVWRDHGNGGTTGDLSFGTIVSDGTVNEFSPFTLASVSLENPLPIELIDFSAIKNGKVVDLFWETATERNNDYFTIEKSANGTDWQEVAMINGAGNSSSSLRYKHTDMRPLPGLSYYRLKQTDFDGQYEYFDIRAVDFTDKNSNRKVIKTINLLGQEVEPDTKGMVIKIYSDGYKEKIINTY